MLLVILQKSLIASMVVLESGENLANNCNIVFKFSCWLLIVAIIFSTWRLPSVRVPVLSRQRVSTLANVSIQ